MGSYKDYVNYPPETLKLTLDRLDSLRPLPSPLANVYRSIIKAYKLKTDPQYAQQRHAASEKQKAYILDRYYPKVLIR